MKIRSITSILLAAAMSLSLAACGGGSSSGNGSSAPSESGSREGIVSDQLVQFGDYDFSDEDTYIDMTNVSEMDGRLYAGGNLSGPEGDYTFIGSFLPDGSDFREIRVGDPYASLYISALAFAEDGSACLAMTQYSEVSAEGGTLAADEEPELLLYLKRVDPDGKEVWSVPLRGEGPQDDYYYAGSAVISGDRVYVAGSFGVRIFSYEDGSSLGQVDGIKASDSDVSLIPMGDGTLYFRQMEDSGKTRLTLIGEDGKTGQSVTMPETRGVWINRLRAGSDGRLYGGTEKGIYAFAPGDTDFAQVVNFVSSDIALEQVEDVLPLADGSYFVTGYGDGSYEYHLMTPLDPSEIKDKKEITVGILYSDDSVRRQLTAFNRENEEYRLVLRDYSENMDDSEDAYEKIREQYNNDIISGSAPDVMILDFSSNLSAYISKGVFEDLTSYWESDPDLKDGEYADNVLNGINPEGKRYLVTPTFSLEGLSIRTSDLGGRDHLTLAEAIQLAKDKGMDPRNLFGYIYREGLLYNALGLTGNRFINEEDGTCSFDTGEFAEILTYAATLPTSDQMDESAWEDGQTLWRDGKALLHNLYMSEVDEYQLEIKGYMGGPVTIMGFPGTEPSSPCFYPSYYLAISNGCKDKDAAWAFIKSFFTEEYQDSIKWNFPVRISSLDKQIEDACTQKYYTDENGNQVPEEPSVWGIGNNIEVRMEVLSREEGKTIRDLLLSIKDPVFYDSEIHDIIEEEASAFFAGSKSAEEVCGIIQSRVQIYLSENR